MSFERFHVPIMGFTQNQSRESGLEKVWRQLREEIPLKTQCLVHPQRWNADFDGLAEFIFRNGGPGTLVNVYAYSWGCGHGFVKLAKALRKRGIQIPQAVLSDPVYHSWWRPWRGLFPAVWNGPIVVPENVWDVHSFYQRLNRPQGTTLKLNNKLAVNREPIEVKAAHEYMDDTSEFRNKVLELATR